MILLCKEKYTCSWVFFPVFIAKNGKFSHINFSTYDSGFLPSDGYDMADLYLHWRSGHHSVHGIQDIELPQFSIVEYRTVEKIESLLTGARATISELLILN